MEHPTFFAVTCPDTLARGMPECDGALCRARPASGLGGVEKGPTRFLAITADGKGLMNHYQPNPNTTASRERSGTLVRHTNDHETRACAGHTASRDDVARTNARRYLRLQFYVRKEESPQG